MDLVSLRTVHVLRRARARRICRPRSSGVCPVRWRAGRHTASARGAVGRRGAHTGLCRTQADERAMRPESIALERADEVRAAADGWRRAGAIDAPTHDAIKRAFPDPCVTPSAVWRVLTAVMVTIVVACTFGALAVTTRPREPGLTALLWLFAVACVVATEYMEASPRLARRGAAGAASSCGIVLFLAGLGLFLHVVLAIGGDAALDALLIASALTWAAGAWRWGSPLFAGLSAASLLVVLARLPFGRVVWVIVGSALVGLATPRLDDGALAPSHRRAATVVLLTGIA